MNVSKRNTRCFFDILSTSSLSPLGVYFKLYFKTPIKFFLAVVVEPLPSPLSLLIPDKGDDAHLTNFVYYRFRAMCLRRRKMKGRGAMNAANRSGLRCHSWLGDPFRWIKGGRYFWGDVRERIFSLESGRFEIEKGTGHGNFFYWRLDCCSRSGEFIIKLN